MPDTLVKSPTEAVVAKVNALGLKRAAKKFKTSPSSLSRWLRGQGFQGKYQYVRVTNPTTAALMAHAQEVIHSDEGREPTPQTT